MAGFKFAYNSANRVSPPKKYLIGATTVVKKGALVKFVIGSGVEELGGTLAAAMTSPILGVAAAGHDGVTDDGVNKATLIEVYSDPNDVFELRSTYAITADSGSTSTFVEANTGDGDVTDLFKNGYLEVVTCAADSTMVGEMIKITGYTHSSGSFAFATQRAAFAVGDTARLHPGKNAVGFYKSDASSDSMDIAYLAGDEDGLLMLIVDAEPESKKCFYKIRLNQLGGAVTV